MKHLKLVIILILSIVIVYVTTKEFLEFNQAIEPSLHYKFTLSFMVVLSAGAVYISFLGILKIINLKSIHILNNIAKIHPKVIYRKYDQYYLDTEILKENGQSKIRFYLLSQKDIDQIQNRKFI